MPSIIEPIFVHNSCSRATELQMPSTSTAILIDSIACKHVRCSIYVCSCTARSQQHCDLAPDPCESIVLLLQGMVQVLASVGCMFNKVNAGPSIHAHAQHVSWFLGVMPLRYFLAAMCAGWGIMWRTTLHKIGFFREILGLNR